MLIAFHTTPYCRAQSQRIVAHFGIDCLVQCSQRLAQFTRLDEIDMYVKYAALGVEFRMLVNDFLEKGRVEKIIDPFKGL